jgi:N-acetylmuramoyl-L-alanine amidase
LVAALVVVAVLFGVGGAAIALRAGDRSAVAATTTTSIAPTTTASPSTTTTTTTTPSSTTTTAAPTPWPTIPSDGVARAVVTPTGVVLAVLSTTGDGRYVARAPCGGEVTVAGTPLAGATVVLDPGHGGDEAGALGEGGAREKDVNLAIAQETKRQLEAQGATVVLTRTGDYRITLASRAAIAQALHPAMFISIHHNADPDEHRTTPGAETYHQIASAESKRAAGLVYEEI